ncbi:hypothetical protein MKW98_005837, partial [Papaver atlanticum]
DINGDPSFFQFNLSYLLIQEPCDVVVLTLLLKPRFKEKYILIFMHTFSGEMAQGLSCCKFQL